MWPRPRLRRYRNLEYAVPKLLRIQCSRGNSGFTRQKWTSHETGICFSHRTQVFDEFLR